MTADETLADIYGEQPPSPHPVTSAIRVYGGDDWTDETLAILRDDGPATVSELALLPAYTQSEWDRRMVRWLTVAEDAETYLWNNLDLPDDVLIRALLQMLGRHPLGAERMSPDGPYSITHADEGTVYAAMVRRREREAAEASAPKPAPVRAKAPVRRRRPSQARKDAGAA